jgi:hypothetical protein
MAFLYIRSGYWAWGPVLFHATSNTAWQMASHSFDPIVEGVTMAVAALVVVLAATRPRAKTKCRPLLARNRP